MCSTPMKSLDHSTTTRRKGRSIFPMLIVAFAGGLWIWGAVADRNLDQALAVSVEQAVDSVCNRTPMPPEINWLIPTLKSEFVKSITPLCTEDTTDSEGLVAHTTRGDVEGASGQASHTVTISAGGHPVIHLRIQAATSDVVTVIGWSRP